MAEPVIPATGPFADTGTRFVAALIDGVILWVITVILLVVIRSQLANALGLILNIGYFGGMEGQPSGQTMGKKVMGIRVIDTDTGGRLETGTAFTRAVVRLASGFALGLGFFWALWDPKKQTWHDKAAGTVVVPVSAYPIESDDL